MGIHWEPLTSDSVSACAALWSDRQAYTAVDFELALARLRRLLEERRAVGALVIENGRVRGFGATAFVSADLIERLLAAPTPQLGKRLLLGDADAGTGVLTSQQIAAGNATTGLDVAVVNTNYDPQARDPDAVIGAVIGAYHAVHRGYNIARLINEVNGERAIAVATTSGSFELRARFNDVGGVPGLASALFTLSREDATARRNPLMAMFVYSPPRICFTESEQNVLRSALAGDPDSMIAQRLGVPLTSVKSRWSRLQERAFTVAPDLFPNPGRLSTAGRGPQVRHLILRYVQQHPSELTPYLSRRPSTATIRRGATRHARTR